MKEISAKEAYEKMQKDPEYIYLDVRSIPEFEQGHAAGAMNIPIMHFDPSVGMFPNEEFTKVVDANLARDAKLVVGCKMGGRSSRACEILTQMGYTDVTNINGGFSGATDNIGRVVEPGWSMLGLPVSTGSGEDAGYEKLSAKAKAK